jgi:hypothetical protein
MYQIELTKEQQAGFDYQATLTGVSVQDNIQRIVASYGEGYLINKNADKVNQIVETVKADPEAYASVIEAKRIELAIK